MTRTYRSLLFLTVLALVGTACGGQSNANFDVGLQRVALDLAFKDEDLANAPVPLFDGTLPLPGEALVGLTRPRPLPFVIREVCPAAPKDAIPPETTTAGIDRQVTPGRYVYRNKGEYEVTGPIPVKGALPPISVLDYRDPKTLPQPNDTFGEAVPDKYSWTVTQPITGDSFIRREFVATPTELQLTRLTYHIGDEEFVFAPTPAINMMDLGVENEPGATWDSAGTDPATGTSMIVRGGLLRRELVDACGKVYEAYKIRSTERIVSLAGGASFSSQTDDASHPPYFPDPPPSNYYWVATQYGGLFLEEETHTLTTVGGLIISIDGTSTIASLDPQPLPKERR
ncbi:MAG TPA: hypothetical protein VMZ22_14260 [Acidimicrobiales bacterium]|nr:hypothetical protein [Acidimicrobiales bacterium]